ncbi:hypothetical protein PENTCL1PPCAC_18166, partial [Pristionchus entomophagus]
LSTTMSPPSLLLLFLLIGSVRSFYFSPFYNHPREEFKVHPLVGISPSGRFYSEEPRRIQLEIEEAKPKRYKPCFYSPIQCLIRK